MGDKVRRGALSFFMYLNGGMMNYWLWLATLRGIGSIRKQILLEKFDKIPEKIFKATKQELMKIDRIGPKLAEEILNNKDFVLINKMEKYMKMNKIKQVNFYDEEYPQQFKNMCDPPTTLFYKGDIKIANSNCISVVGSRNATKYGLDTSYKIGKDLACNNYTVVSGMARGIDTKAHEGALIAQNGKTIAVVGCGLDRIYPAENAKLFKQISERGLILSEYVVGTKVEPGNFPARNRIISGLSEKLVVVEATPKSGAMITVNFALEQGKEVYVVPGNINSFASHGTNELIKDGALVYTCVDDIL